MQFLNKSSHARLCSTGITAAYRHYRPVIHRAQCSAYCHYQLVHVAQQAYCESRGVLWQERVAPVLDEPARGKMPLRCCQAKWMCTVHTRTNASIHATTEPQPKECQKMGSLITIIMTTEVTPLSLAQPRIHVCVLAERPTEWRGGGGGMLKGRSERGGFPQRENIPCKQPGSGRWFFTCTALPHGHNTADSVQASQTCSARK